jgi:hypothetical protein
LDREQEHQKERLLATKEQLNSDLVALERQIEAGATSPNTDLPNYDQYPIDAYEQILSHLEKAVRSLTRQNYSQVKAQNLSWWQRLWYFLHQLWQQITKTSTSHILKRLYSRIHAPLTATLATPFPFQLPLNRESLKAARVQVALQLEEVRASKGRS